MSTLACPPNANFIKQYTQGQPMKKSRHSGSSNEITDTTNSYETIKTDRNLSRTNSRRMIIRASSTDKLESNTVKRAASTAGLLKNKPSFHKVEPKLSQKVKHGPYVWIVYS